MKDWKSQAHVKWECKYHVVILPKYRKKVLYGTVRRRIGEILRDLCRQKGVELEEGKLMPDHIHMLLSVPPKYSFAMTMGYLKGKSAVRIHRELLKTKGTLFGRTFWARGYCVSTVGLDEQQIRQYIKEQEKLQKQQLEFDFDQRPLLGAFLIPPVLLVVADSSISGIFRTDIYCFVWNICTKQRPEKVDFYSKKQPQPLTIQSEHIDMRNRILQPF